jgi:hypothetical protein
VQSSVNDPSRPPHYIKLRGPAEDQEEELRRIIANHLLRCPDCTDWIAGKTLHWKLWVVEPELQP